MKNENLEKIAAYLKVKGNLKQEVYQRTFSVFENLKQVLENYANQLKSSCKEDLFEVDFKENGKFEAEIKFAGDILIFNMHTNIFSFSEEYFINNTAYVKEDESRKYCGMIEVYNFLADSFKYQRYGDAGYLVSRIFINKEGHFFVEGEEQLGFLYKDFDNLVINEDFLALIVEQAMLFSINFDLWVPSYHEVRELTVGEKIQQTGTLTHKTSKRLGFAFSSQKDEFKG
ncbi:MAG: hypothetical protein H6579_01095 [Chitinophagales bacterium]|nr:hypothetical protein [Bacteroidota bacterium]MCB9255705.1 hypothetical protein [Chitinophagales bacterium]